MNKITHPILQLFQVLLLPSFLFFLTFSIIIITDGTGGDFEEIRNNYKAGLLATILISSLGSILILYYLIKGVQNTPELTESDPIISWSYEKSYWERIKIIEIRKKVLLYLFKTLSIWIPVSAFIIFLLDEVNGVLSTILTLYALIFTLPAIPFTLGKFIKEINCQFFKNRYDVKIYTRGLTINDVYFPFTTTLLAIKQVNGCLKFTIEKQFRSMNPGVAGGAVPSLTIRSSYIYIPIPEHESVNLNRIKKQLKINRSSNL